jgi:hypothetical protein
LPLEQSVFARRNASAVRTCHRSLSRGCAYTRPHTPLGSEAGPTHTSENSLHRSECPRSSKLLSFAIWDVISDSADSLAQAKPYTSDDLDATRERVNTSFILEANLPTGALDITRVNCLKSGLLLADLRYS